MRSLVPWALLMQAGCLSGFDWDLRKPDTGDTGGDRYTYYDYNYRYENGYVYEAYCEYIYDCQSRCGQPCSSEAVTLVLGYDEDCSLDGDGGEGQPD
jgi:hypothetical protein